MPREVLSRLFTPSICRTCRTKLLQPSKQSFHRAFSSTPRSLEDDRSSASSSLASLSSLIQNSPSNPEGRRFTDRTTGLADAITNVIPGRDSSLSSVIRREPPPEPHHLHIYSTKHNTHITLTRPNREPIISFSCGNIGFRKAQRGSYDAAFQLSAYVFKMMKDRGLLRHANERDMEFEDLGMKTEGAIKTMEVVLRGFGRGRDAVVKALMGNEGRGLRDRVIRVSDSTRLKFGGTRSPKPRRLG